MDDPRWRLTPVGICHLCRNLADGGRTCAAFPDGIPVEVLVGEHDHHEPYPGDHGILFEPLDDGAGGASGV